MFELLFLPFKIALFGFKLAFCLFLLVIGLLMLPFLVVAGLVLVLKCVL
jgi:hypothetical protein